jgi:putative spermidine/putrescine transport system permease protein
MRRRSQMASLVLPALAVVIVLLVLPLLYLLSFSFFDANDGPIAVGGFTVRNYKTILSDQYYWRIFGKTLALSAITTVLSASIGYSLAYFIWQQRRWQSLLLVITLSPLLISIVVSSYGWLALLGKNGLINQTLIRLGLVNAPLQLLYSNATIVVGLVHITLPFMVLSILAALERIEPAVQEAAATLGANRYRTQWSVILPLARPGFASGMSIVFCLSLSAYVTPAMLGPSGPNFVTTLIYNEFVTQLHWSTGAALAAILMTVALATVYVYVHFMGRADRLSGGARS